ncbi:MAG: hypothetical protein LBB63_01610 [Holosporaceae bacterium]|nr:hypothetical protein [Holosporaceae bacterium]
MDEENQTEILQEIRDPGGKLLKTITMKDGIPNGPMVIYDENGKVSGKLNYDNGILSGPAEFFLSEKPLMLTFFENGLQEGESILFSNGIKVGVANYRCGVLEGAFTSFDNEGNVIRIAIYAGGSQNGECQTFYPDGTLMEQAVYKSNLPDGQVIKYFPNGNVMEVSTFQEGKPYGYVDTYDADGDLKSRREV